jgi:hypothetical protein
MPSPRTLVQKFEMWIVKMKNGKKTIDTDEQWMKGETN